MPTSGHPAGIIYLRASHITLTVLASKSIDGIECKKTILAFFACPLISIDIGFACTLTIVYVANSQRSNGSWPMTLTINASLLMMNFQVPKQGFAGVANSTHDMILADAKCARWGTITATISFKVLSDAPRIAIAFFAEGIIVTFWILSTSITFGSSKIRFAITFALTVTGGAFRSKIVAVTSQTVWILKVPGRALVALTTSIVILAGTLSILRIAHLVI